MAISQYAARNPQGKVIAGSSEAGSQAMAVKQLREQGLIPIAIQGGALGAGAAARRRRH